jgi:hypothetical protein
MFHKKKALLVMPAALALLILWGCSGGAGGGGSLTAGGGIGGSGVTVGSVSKFGSVFVNDVEYGTTDAVVVVDGAEKGSGDQTVLDNLSVGKLVRIEGPSAADGTGTAQRIVYNEDVIGPVESITAVDADTSRLVVMGQTVIADRQTNFVNTTLATIAVGNVVEVSGFGDDQGFIHAGYLKMRADVYTSGSEVQVRGTAADVNTLLRTFKINQLNVDYSTADLSQLTNGAPQTGQLLEVKGILNAGGTLVATLVKPEDILGVATADNVEISGIVTLFNSFTDFEVGGIAVLTDGATEFNDILPEDIDVGSKLIVSGSLTNRVLLADTVRSTAQVKIESNVSSVGSSSLTLDGLALEDFTLLSVNVNDLTKILGAADSIVEIFPGDHVKIFGTSFSSGNATASKIIVKKQSKDTVALRGPVENVSLSGGSIAVLGVTIDTGSTGSIPDSGFSLENGGQLTRLEFQSRVTVGDSVNAKGNLSGAAVNWLSIELGKSD